MGNRFSSLKCKEVVNVCDGCRLGYVGDVECILPQGQDTSSFVTLSNMGMVSFCIIVLSWNRPE